MLLARIRRFAEAHHRAWCFAGILLVFLQPFIAVHFCCDGIEDEPMLRVRALGETSQFEADDRENHASDRETTIFAQVPAGIDHPHALNAGLNTLLALVLALLPLALIPIRPIRPASRLGPAQVPPRGGAPPPALPWKRRPPAAAPPLAH
ncbi:hypothetical protein ACEN9J_33080 [Variovorax sp. Varisp41]|uniref:hypothetical protein n=1 Tax=Variovorax sp. Varisp41 TaxID=3243033 RepID=UPI0039B3814D